MLLSTLRPCSEDEVCRLITALPTKSCTLDPIPTFLLKEVVDVLLPYVTAMINASPREGRLPSSDDAMTSLAARGSIAVAVHTSIPKQLPPSPLPLFTPSLTNATLFITACPLQVSDPAPTDPELTCTCCCQINQIQYITPIVRSLHWLKITERIKYKLLSLTYKVLTTTQPSYLHNLITV